MPVATFTAPPLVIERLPVLFLPIAMPSPALSAAVVTFQVEPAPSTTAVPLAVSVPVAGGTELVACSPIVAS